MKSKIFALLFTVLLGAIAISDVTPPDKEVLNETKTERLTLYHVATEPESSSAPGVYRTVVGYDFHSLVWRTRRQTGWVKRAEITKDDFQQGTDHRRWIDDTHCVDAKTGYAILKVVEGDVPISASKVHYVRTWREWDMQHNREVRTIRTCKEPNEPY